MNPFLIFDLSVPITSGSHSDDEGNCSVEILGLAIYGHRQFGYELPCIDAGCQGAVVAVTDNISDEVKQTRRWRLLIARLATCHTTKNERVHRRSALWAARSIEHLSSAAKACNDVTERWLAGEAADEELAAARLAAAMAWEGAMAGEGNKAWAEGVAAWTAAGAAEVAVAAGGPGARVAKVVDWKAPEDALIDWLDDFLTAHFKIMVDEGEAIPEDIPEYAEEEYLAFVAALDFETGKEPSS